MLPRDVFSVVCRVLCAKMIGATSSAGFNMVVWIFCLRVCSERRRFRHNDDCVRFVSPSGACSDCRFIVWSAVWSWIMCVAVAEARVRPTCRLLLSRFFTTSIFRLHRLLIAFYVVLSPSRYTASLYRPREFTTCTAPLSCCFSAIFRSLILINYSVVAFAIFWWRFSVLVKLLQITHRRTLNEFLFFSENHESLRQNTPS